MASSKQEEELGTNFPMSLVILLSAKITNVFYRWLLFQ